MAVKTFDEILTGLSAQEKSLLDNLFAKEPELKAGWLRQDDYSRKQNELKAKETEYEEAVDYQKKMEPWAATTYERIHSLEEAGVIDGEGKVLWIDQKAKLEQELEAARKAAVAGGDMTPEQLNAEVRKIIADAGGVLTREEIQALYQNESKKLVDDGFKEREAKFNSETIPMVGGFSAAVAVVANHYEQESGKRWTKDDSARLYGVMSQEGKFDALEVEEKFLEPIRAEKKREADIEAEVQRRIGQRGVPGGGGERYIPQPGEPKGALQAALETSGSGSDLETLINTKAVEAGSELLAAGKS